LKQYNPEQGSEGFDYNDPEKLIKALGFTDPDQEVMLTTTLANELKQQVAKAKQVPLFQLDLRMMHVKEVTVDYDTLTKLVEQLLNEVNEKKFPQARETQSQIIHAANGMEDPPAANQIIKATDAIINGWYPPEGSGFKYPAKLDSYEQVVREANTVSLDRRLLDFRNKWGITDIVDRVEMRDLMNRHRYGQQDLDDTGRLRDIITKASVSYTTLATDESVQGLTKIKYRNQLREAIYKLADQLVETQGGVSQ
jgi:type I restriction enzyme R subunit